MTQAQIQGRSIETIGLGLVAGFRGGGMIPSGTCPHTPLLIEVMFCFGDQAGHPLGVTVGGATEGQDFPVLGVAGIALERQAAVVTNPAGQAKLSMAGAVEIFFIIIAFGQGRVPVVRAARVDFLGIKIAGQQGCYIPAPHGQGHRRAKQCPLAYGVAPKSGIISQMHFRRHTFFSGPTRGQQIQPTRVCHCPAAAQQQGVLLQIAVLPQVAPFGQRPGVAFLQTARPKHFPRTGFMLMSEAGTAQTMLAGSQRNLSALAESIQLGR